MSENTFRFSNYKQYIIKCSETFEQYTYVLRCHCDTMRSNDVMYIHVPIYKRVICINYAKVYETMNKTGEGTVKHTESSKCWTQLYMRETSVTSLCPAIEGDHSDGSQSNTEYWLHLGDDTQPPTPSQSSFSRYTS